MWYRRNKTFTGRRYGLWGTLLLVAAGMCLGAVENKVIDLKTSRGLRIRFIQEKEMLFVHAQLVVFYENMSTYLSQPGIPYLTIFNMFSGDIRGSSSALLGSLRKLGNDYRVENSPDYTKIVVNFLPDRISQFGGFLNELFTYDSFHLKAFSESKENYWGYLKDRKEWKKEAASQIAYSQFFSSHQLGLTLITPDLLKTINLAQLRAFCQQNFRPENALLILKGSINPNITLGLIEREMQFGLKPIKAEVKEERLVINNNRRVFLLNSKDNDLPMVFFFDIAPPSDHVDFIPFFVVNYTLFHYPIGRLYQSDRTQLLHVRNYQLNNEIVVHKGISVLCSYAWVNHGDIENLVTLVDQEKKRLNLHTVEKNEFVNALNYFRGKLMVNTEDYENEVEIEINKAITANSEKYLPNPAPDAIQKVSLEKINDVAGNYFLINQKAGIREKGIIVIVGNATQILGDLKSLKPEVIDLFGE
jgi:predicted Zn-dependent peptidase